ncbi:hemerythrin domain-containing protein [Noviherbaspirillum sp.]|jgi:hemerythrin superfamily protein|uniref:hemerythrin domain-containing protein n=1 Tax=Noviherbaspirillum sp. TaxID=1926288 RepID=UPI0025F09C3D|nr:hemerythrin domain-containing protein [Noviherbaspirillum sp.]
MNIDAKTRGRGEFPVDRPMDALKADHHLVRQLFDNYFHAGDADDKRDAGSHVLLLLEMHTSLEEGVFYPRVHDADASLVEHCEQDHEQARQLIDRLKLMDESDPQAEQLFHELADAIFRHIELEEQQLFPKVQQAGLDLSAIGHEMQAFETRMNATRLQKPVAPGLRK